MISKVNKSSLRKHIFLLSNAILISLITFSQTNYDSLLLKYYYYSDRDDLENAMSVARQINQLTFKYEGDTSLNYATSYRLIGNSFIPEGFSVNSIDSALYYYRISQNILIRQNRIQHKEYTACLYNIGRLYLGIMQEDSAFFYLESAYNSSIYLKNENIPLKYMSLIGLARLYHQAGDYKLADTYFRKFILEYEKSSYKKDPIFSYMLILASDFYTDLGDEDIGIKLLNYVVSFHTKNNDENNADYAMALNNLGSIYFNKLEYKKAQYYFETSLKIFEKTIGKAHPNYALSLNNLGEVYILQKSYKKAEQYLREALRLYHTNDGNFDSEKADNYIKIANLYKSQKNTDSARKYYLYAIEIIKTSRFIAQEVYEKAYVDYASFLEENQEISEAYNYYKSIFEHKSSTLVQNFEWLSDSQKDRIWQKEGEFYSKLFNFCAKSFKILPKVGGLAFNVALFYKGRLLESKISKEDYYSSIEVIRNQLLLLKKQLVKLELDGKVEDPIYLELSDKSDSLDKLLSLSWPLYQQQKNNLSVSWIKIKQYLADGQVAIEFMRYTEGENARYLALLLRKEFEFPKLIELSVTSKNALLQETSKLELNKLYNSIWAPLNSYLDGVKSVYYSPIGSLNYVPFDALVIDSTHYLIDLYELRRLTCTRQIAIEPNYANVENSNISSTLIGGVNYNYFPFSSLTYLSDSTKETLPIPNYKFSYLPGTKLEIDSVSHILSEKKVLNYVITGDSATKDLFNTCSGNDAKTILHIATHGFYFDKTYKGFDGTFFSTNYVLNKNPLMRCGLILAGGNYAFVSNDAPFKEGENKSGILTGLEISQLNLRKTKLAILSACLTGLGETSKAGDDFGLIRAFKLAGIKQIIASIFEIPDFTTLEFMTNFYHNLLESKSINTSFYKSQRDMRFKYPNEPKIWSGFILLE